MDIPIASKQDWTTFSSTFSAADLCSESYSLNFDGELPSLVVRGRWRIVEAVKDRGLAEKISEFWRRQISPCLYSVDYPTLRSMARFACYPKMWESPALLKPVLQELWARHENLLYLLRTNTAQATAECEEALQRRATLCQNLEAESAGHFAAPLDPCHSFLREGPTVLLQARNGEAVTVHQAALAPYEKALSASPDLLSTSSQSVLQIFVNYAERRAQDQLIARELIHELAIFCVRIGALELYDTLLEAMEIPELIELSRNLPGDRILLKSLTDRIHDGADLTGCFSRVLPKALAALLADADGSPAMARLLLIWLRAYGEERLEEAREAAIRTLSANAHLLAETSLDLAVTLSWPFVESVLEHPDLCIDDEPLRQLVLSWIDQNAQRDPRPQVDRIDRYLALNALQLSEFGRLFGREGPYRNCLSSERRQLWLQWYQTREIQQQRQTPCTVITPHKPLAGVAKGPSSPNVAEAVQAREATNQLVTIFKRLGSNPLIASSTDQCAHTANEVAKLWLRADISQLQDDDYRGILELAARLAWVPNSPAATLETCAQDYFAAASAKAHVEAKRVWNERNHRTVTDLEARVAALQEAIRQRNARCLRIVMPTGFYDWTSHVRKQGNNVLTTLEAGAELRIDARMLPADTLASLQRLSPRYPRAVVAQIVAHFTGIGFDPKFDAAQLASLWRELGRLDQTRKIADAHVGNIGSAAESVRWLAALQDSWIYPELEDHVARSINFQPVDLSRLYLEQFKRLLTLAKGDNELTRWRHITDYCKAPGAAPNAMRQLLSYIDWQQCPQVFYQDLGIQGPWANVLTAEEREAWTEFLGGQGQRPEPLQGRDPVDWNCLGDKVVRLPKTTVVGASQLTGSLHGNPRDGWSFELTCSGRWNDVVVNDNQALMSIQAIFDPFTREIEVRYKLVFANLFTGRMIGAVMGDKRINTFPTLTNSEEGKRMAVFSDVPHPHGGRPHTVTIDIPAGALCL